MRYFSEKNAKLSDINIPEDLKTSLDEFTNNQLL
jgi:hypothetical protein